MADSSSKDKDHNIKASEGEQSEQTKGKQPEKAALYAVVINSLSTVLKFLMASLTGSLAVMAEAFHSLSDIITSILVFIAVRTDRLGAEKAEKSPQTQSPLFQMIISLFIGFILLVVSVNIFQKAWGGTKETIESSVLAGVLLLIASAGSYFLSRFEIAVGESTNSMALIADGHHSNVDMLGALLVSLSLFSNALGWNVDIYAALIIGLLIFFQSLEILGNVLWFAVSRSSQKSEFSYVKRKHIVAGILSGKWSVENFLAWLNRKTGIDLVDTSVYRRLNAYGSKIFLIICFCIYLLTCFTVVAVDEEGLLFRCGKLVKGDQTGKIVKGWTKRGTLPPGLCIKYPWPFDKVIKVPVKKAQVIYVGFEGEGKGDKILWTERHHEVEYEMLTGDSQFITVFLTVEYHINDLLKYYMASNGAKQMLEGIANSEIIKMLSELEFFEMAIHNRHMRAKTLKERMQKATDTLGLGISVDLVAFKDIHPPVSVAPKFEAVISAEEEKESIINQAEAIRNRLIPLARAEGKRRKAEADSYGVAITGKAYGKGQRFLLKRPETNQTREVIMKQLFFELQSSVLKRPVKVLVGDNCEPPAVIMVPSGSSGLAIAEDYNDYGR